MSKEYYINGLIHPCGNKIIFIDWDVDNPNCAGDPYVRIGIIDHWPLTVEEHAQFVADNPVIGKHSEVLERWNN